MSITAQIIGKTGPALDKTLASLKGKIDKVVVEDVAYGFDAWRNEHLTEQTLILNPGEELEGEVDVLDGTYRVYVINERFVSKETRIVMPGEGKFVNPVYECFDTKFRPELVSVFIRPAENSYPELVDRWKKEEPGSCEADYYKAFEYLSGGKRDEFLKQGEYFLFRNGQKNPSSVIMMRYYLGCVWATKNPNKAASYFLAGLEVCPTMAEFWCGLGDCFRRTKQEDKALRMYKNALILGKFRDLADDLPILLDMYGAYPESFLGKVEGPGTNLGGASVPV